TDVILFCASWQVTVPLSHLINALHSLKSSVGSSSSATAKPLQKQHASEQDLHSNEPTWSLRDLGLSDLGMRQLDEIVSGVLPRLSQQGVPSSSSPSQKAWRTSHLSSQSFFHNKHGCLFNCFTITLPYDLIFYMLNICVPLFPVWVQSRGFKTLRKHKRLQAGFERPMEPDGFTPSFMKGLLTRDKGMEVETLDKLLKSKNIPDGQQDSFKTGFAEGFLKSQALTQRKQDSLRRMRFILLVLLLVGLYGLSKTPFLSGKGSFFILSILRFRTTSGLDSVDPVQMKNVTFEHVKGVEEAKNELQEVVEFLRSPEKFTVLGGRLPKGILLVGPPGTGKTLLARAVAGEADVPFYYATGSEFDEMFVGVGASRIRNLFREAKANAPCVIFIDELDSVGGKRIESPMHPYSRQTINQLLAEMDGFKPNEGVIIIGATNFPEALDNALIRPGRFDMQVTVSKPDVKGRTEILNWYLRKIKVDPDIEAGIIARGTVGFSGADLENLVNQAALKAAVDGKNMVTLKELEFAKDKILMGEHFCRNREKIEIYPLNHKSPVLGQVSMLPEDDRWSETRAQLLAQMDVSMGGRVAEEIIFGNEFITTGASSDFDAATKIARMMVTRFGMCERLGVMTYADQTKQSPETQAAIEHEVRILLKDSYERARALLKSHAKEHKNLATALLQYETLDAKEIKMVLEGKALEIR
uniref:YME1 like 1 ATPase n=1 Tax=Oncorhynchus kisutch TaxID=8019 RepID=A0A8C7FWY5_ONCKI